MWWAWLSRKSSRSRRRACVRGPREGTETKSSSISSIWPSKGCTVEIRESGDKNKVLQHLINLGGRDIDSQWCWEEYFAKCNTFTEISRMNILYNLSLSLLLKVMAQWVKYLHLKCVFFLQNVHHLLHREPEARWGGEEGQGAGHQWGLSGGSGGGGDCHFPALHRPVLSLSLWNG